MPKWQFRTNRVGAALAAEGRAALELFGARLLSADLLTCNAAATAEDAATHRTLTERFYEDVGPANAADLERGEYRIYLPLHGLVVRPIGVFFAAWVAPQLRGPDCRDVLQWKHVRFVESGKRKHD